MAIGIALLSALLRSLLNLIDRKTFGLQQRHVFATLVVNNLLPLGWLLILLPAMGEFGIFINYLGDVRFIILGFITQLTALVFSLAFKQLKVAEVVVTAKAADVIIPLAFFFSGEDLNWLGFSGSVLTTLVCLPLFSMQLFHHSRVVWVVVAMLFLVVVQATATTAWLPMNEVYWQTLLPVTTVIIFWRLVTAMILPLFVLQARPSRALATRWRDFRPDNLQVSRSVITLLVQLTFVWAVFEGRSNLLIWPILNSTILFSIVLSGLILKEAVDRKYWMAALAILFIVSSISLLQGFST
ncbi:MAG: hypothetical protein RLY85_360 [Bacteroidota bacterium]|jgi:hypothetical protein